MADTSDLTHCPKCMRRIHADDAEQCPRCGADFDLL